jgi:hypothetical protein
VRQLPDDDGEHLLNQIIGVLLLEGIPPQPFVEQGPVQAIQLSPAVAITGVFTQLCQQVLGLVGGHVPSPFP